MEIHEAIFCDNPAFVRLIHVHPLLFLFLLLLLLLLLIFVIRIASGEGVQNVTDCFVDSIDSQVVFFIFISISFWICFFNSRFHCIAQFAIA